MALTKGDDTMSVSPMRPQVLARAANSGLLFTDSQRFGEGFEFCLFEGDLYFLCLSFGAGTRWPASRMSFAVARDGPSGAVAGSVREGSGSSVPWALLQLGVEAGVCEP